MLAYLRRPHGSMATGIGASNSRVVHIDWPPREHVHSGCLFQKPYGRTRSVNLSEVGAAGRHGCYKCMLLHHAYEVVYGYSEEQQQRIFIAIGSVATPNIFRTTYLDSKLSWSAMGTLQIYFPVGSPPPFCDFVGPGRELLSSRSEECQSLIRGWMAECDQKHPFCRSEGAYLPSRVIHLGDEGHKGIFLYRASPGETGSYVALSHCWGITPPSSSHRWRTTTANLEQLQRGLDIDALPQNFRDAIAVTRALGIRYLWIDSLCIIQDDTSDWEVQSSRMADIFKGAAIVLAASQAKDSNGGFVDRHGEMSNKYDDARLSIEIGQTTNPDGSVTVLLARKLPSAWCRESHHNRLSALPLAQRAWTLQETLMARRIAHFMDTELLWECVTSLKCECMQVDCANTSESFNSHGLVRQFNFTNTPHRGPPTSVYEQWRNLLSTYSERAITRETDRLPALSGLAKLYMAKLYKSADNTGRYLAGFWKEDLLQSIIWRIQPGHYQRASPYRAPTWSPFSLEYADTPRGVPFEFEFEHEYWKLGRTHATVVGGECVPAGKDPTGAVKQDSYILLSGVLAQSSCRWAEGASWSNDSGRSILFGDNHIAVDWDVDPDLEQPRTLYSLLIGEAAFGWGKVLPIALVLQRSKVDEAYERVGLLGLYSYGGKELMNIFDGAHETLVKIV